MKTIKLGFGLQKPTPTTTRIMIDVGIETDKPANKHLRNIVASVITVILFGLSIYALEATDVRDTQQAAVVLP